MGPEPYLLLSGKLDYLAAVNDCHDRESGGYEFSHRGRAKEAERAVEEACIARFGTLWPEGTTPVFRSDNGLISQSRRLDLGCLQHLAAYCSAWSLAG